MSSFVNPGQPDLSAIIIIPLQDVLEVSAFGANTRLAFEISTIQQTREGSKGIIVILLAIQDVIRLIALILQSFSLSCMLDLIIGAGVAIFVIVFLTCG